jgi:nitrogen fixation/metabolism regulation signal transduction histidine kinase
MILTCVERLDDTVREFLDYARPVELRMSPREMGPIMEYLRDFIVHDETWGGAQPVITLPEEPLAAVVDPELLQEALLNLLLNSVEAALPNPPDRPLAVEAELSRAPDGGAVVTVSDNGPGFPEEQLLQPFQPYYTTKKKGSGLGLPMVKKVIDAHRGTVTLSNREDGGARVTVTLPPVGPGVLEEARAQAAARERARREARGEAAV